MEPTLAPSTAPDTGIKDRLTNIRARMDAAAIAAGREPSDITLLAVSKTFPPEAVIEAMGCGLTQFGEARLQEALPKIDAVAERLDNTAIDPAPADAAPMPSHGSGPSHGSQAASAWHLIGHLQKNKVVKAVGRFDLIHSVDSLSLAERINRLAAEAGVVQAILIQVNISAEAQKYGVLPDEALAVVSAAGKLPHIRVCGLMGMAAKDQPAAPSFAALKELFDGINDKNLPGVTMEHLSMGMSGDFETAITCGATIIRVGGALFGPRHYQERPS